MTRTDTESANELNELLLRFPEPIWMSEPAAKPLHRGSFKTGRPARRSLLRSRRFRLFIILVALTAASVAVAKISFAVRGLWSTHVVNTSNRPGLPIILQSSLLSEREPSRGADRTCEIALKDLHQTTSALKDALDLRRSIGTPVVRSSGSQKAAAQPRDKQLHNRPLDLKPQVQEALAAPASPSLMENLLAFVTPRQL